MKNKLKKELKNSNRWWEAYFRNKWERELIIEIKNKALKEVQEATIKGMLVEEQKCEKILEICQKIKDIEHKKMGIAMENKLAYDKLVISWIQTIESILVNQCCAIQKERSKDIK